MIMATRAYLAGAAVPELTDSQIKEIYVNLDIQFNNTMLTALLYGKKFLIHMTDFSQPMF